MRDIQVFLRSKALAPTGAVQGEPERVSAAIDLSLAGAGRSGGKLLPGSASPVAAQPRRSLFRS